MQWWQCTEIMITVQKLFQEYTPIVIIVQNFPVVLFITAFSQVFCSFSFVYVFIPNTDWHSFVSLSHCAFFFCSDLKITATYYSNSHITAADGNTHNFTFSHLQNVRLKCATHLDGNPNSRHGPTYPQYQFPCQASADTDRNGGEFRKGSIYTPGLFVESNKNWWGHPSFNITPLAYKYFWI